SGCEERSRLNSSVFPSRVVRVRSRKDCPSGSPSVGRPSVRLSTIGGEGGGDGPGDTLTARGGGPRGPPHGGFPPPPRAEQTRDLAALPRPPPAPPPTQRVR